MATESRTYPGGAYADDDGRFWVPRDKIKPFSQNPRDPSDLDYQMSPAFRQLVNSIKANGIQNPVQVFWEDGMYQLIAGHRRLAAAALVEEMDIARWKKDGEPGDKPDTRFAYVPAVVRSDIKGSDYQRFLAMLNDEETSERWPEVRRFSFFRVVRDAAPPNIQMNIERLASECGMRPSTVKTYLQFVSNPEISEAMADPSETRLKRSGRMKALRAVYRMVIDLTEERSAVVQYVLGNNTDIGGVEAQSELAALLIEKLRVYDRVDLAVGPGVAMERTVPLVDPMHVADVSDDEFIEWLQDESILRKDVAEARATRMTDPSVRSMQQTLKDRVYERPGSMDIPDLQTYCDELQVTADWLNDEAKKARAALQRKLSV